MSDFWVVALGLGMAFHYPLAVLADHLTESLFVEPRTNR